MFVARVRYRGRILAEARHATRQEANDWCARVCPPEDGWTTSVDRERRRNRLFSLLRRVS